MAGSWGVIWPDGTYTAGIAQFARDLTFYAKQHGGQVYEIGSADDPEAHHNAANTEELFA